MGEEGCAAACTWGSMRPPMPNLDDAELLTQARDGDPKALERLLGRYQPQLLRFGLRMCRNREDAEDVVQDAMFAAARTFESFRGEASVSTWLYTIARSFCIKKRRRSKFAPAEIASLDEDRADLFAAAETLPRTPEESASEHELEEAIRIAMFALDPGQREVLVLRDVEGLSAKEVAEVTELSVGAVKSKLHRARSALKRALEPLVGEVVGEPTGPECPTIEEMFSKQLEGEVDADLCRSMQAHVDGCERCKASCHLLNNVLKTCQATPVPQVPQTVQAAVRRAVRSRFETSEG